MQLKLYSRTAEVGGRQVKVHEMTEGELRFEKRVSFFVGVALGFALATVSLVVPLAIKLSENLG